jgi:CheY-like chemotaxis protein
VTSGVEALAATARQDFDLILMDCQMPEMDGYEAAATIRAQQRNRHTPIIAVTANVMVGERERCLAAGMDDYLSKPFSKEQLRAAVLNAISPDLVRSESEEPAVSPAEMEALRLEAQDLGIDLFERLVQAFSDEAAQALTTMEAGANSGDAELIRSTAHRLKGSGANFGAQRLRRLCEEIEGFVQEGNLREAIARIPLLRKEVERVASALQLATKSHFKIQAVNRF